MHAAKDQSAVSWNVSFLPQKFSIYEKIKENSRWTLYYVSGFTMTNSPFNDFHWWKVFIFLNYSCSRLPITICHSNHNPFMGFSAPKTFQNQPWEEERCICTKMFQIHLPPSAYGKYMIQTFQYVCIPITQQLEKFPS